MEAVSGKSDLSAAPAPAEDLVDGMMVCTDHPYRNNLGGICAFCLQEKLGKLISSSLPLPMHNSPSSGSSPVSFTSDVGSSAHTSNLSRATFSGSGANHSPRVPNPVERDSGGRRARIPFLLARRRKKKKKKLPEGPSSCGPPEASLKRSKSGAGPRSGTGRHFLDVLGDSEEEYGYIPRTRRGGGGFWSFLHLSSSSSSSSKSGTSRREEKPSSDSKVETLSAFEERPNVNSNQFPAIDRKVSRSRSVGCGSRSFSGDFFERISTGFGDCTLRRVESHREGHSNRTPERVQSQQQQGQKIYKCGGIFGGLMMIAAPLASSSYRVSSSTISEDHLNSSRQVRGKPSVLVNGSDSRGRSWNWAFASPMRAFTKSSNDAKRETSIIRDGSGKNSAPNLSAIPSLLTVGG